MVFKSSLNDFLDKNKNRSDQRISLKIGAIFLTRHFLFIFVFLFDSTQKVTYFRHFSVFSTPFQSIQSFYTFFVFPLSIHTLLQQKTAETVFCFSLWDYIQTISKKAKETKLFLSLYFGEIWGIWTLDPTLKRRMLCQLS